METQARTSPLTAEQPVAKVVQERKMGTATNSRPRHGHRKKALSRKRIGWLYPIFRNLHFYHGLLGEEFSV